MIFYWLFYPQHFEDIYILYIIGQSVDSENLASVVHKSLFYKLSSIFLLCVGEFEFYIKWYIIIWSVGDRDLVCGGDSSCFLRFIEWFCRLGSGRVVL